MLLFSWPSWKQTYRISQFNEYLESKNRNSDFLYQNWVLFYFISVSEFPQILLHIVPFSEINLAYPYLCDLAGFAGNTVRGNSKNLSSNRFGIFYFSWQNFLIIVRFACVMWLGPRYFTNLENVFPVLNSDSRNYFEIILENGKYHASIIL